jgi:ribonuclease P protein component
MQKRFRLRRSDDFARLRKIGRAHRHPFAVFSYAENDLGHNRYGFIVGRRVGNAVKRNRARRLMRESLRLLHPYIHPGVDIVLIARTAIVGKRFAEVDAAVQNLLARAGLLMEAAHGEQYEDSRPAPDSTL